jgi:hypothetical protein
MELRPTWDATQTPDEGVWVGYAVDRLGSRDFTPMLAEFVRDLDLDELRAAIDVFGLEMVAEQFLRALIDGGRLLANEAAAAAERVRLREEDRRTSPTVHPLTVADLADEFTRLGLTATRSCR